MAFTVTRIPARWDNYIFILHDPEQGTAAVVDPTEATGVLQLLRSWGARLVAIFNTHHHGDHVGGNLELREHFPGAVVYGGAEDRGRIPDQTVFLGDGDQVTFGGVVGEVLFVPGHTRGHIAYYFPGHLFCGDTLFSGSCGRLFEGTPAQMLGSLDRLAQLPPDTLVWCAHEYTLSNLKFALTVDGQNPDLQARFRAVQALRAAEEPTIPSTIGIERSTNPFLRVDQPALQGATGYGDRVRVFAELRQRKDHF